MFSKKDVPNGCVIVPKRGFETIFVRCHCRNKNERNLSKEQLGGFPTKARTVQRTLVLSVWSPTHLPNFVSLLIETLTVYQR